MVDPQIIVMTGDSYDRSTIEQALAGRDDWRNPRGLDYLPNLALRTVITNAIRTGMYQPIGAYPLLDFGGLNEPIPNKRLW